MTDMQFAIIMTIRTGPYFFVSNEKSAIKRMESKGWVKPLKVGSIQRYVGPVSPKRGKEGMYQVTKKGLKAYKVAAGKQGITIRKDP